MKKHLFDEPLLRWSGWLSLKGNVMNKARSITYLAVCLIIATFAAHSAALSQDDTDKLQGFFRFPDIFQDRIIFTSEGDLWTAPATGGTAVRLTTAEGEERFAKFSPDGKYIAFTGEYDGNADVYVMPATGGEPVRLTYHPSNDQVVGWTPDGKVLFRSFFESGNYYYKLFAVPPDGGYPEALPLDKGATLTYEPEGPGVAFTRLFRAFRTWKRYHGGWAEDIWVGNLADRDFKKITDYSGTDRFPMWIGDRIYFESDSSGRANIWSIDPNRSERKQITFHTDYDVRWPSASRDRIVYQLAMDVWLLDLESGQTSRVNITLPSDRLQCRPKFIDAKANISNYNLSPDGRRMVIAARGELFSIPTKKEGLTRRVSIAPTSRQKDPSFSPDGTTVMAVSDATGEEELWLWDALGGSEPTQLTDSKLGWHYQPQYSPDGKWISFSDFKCRLNLFNIESKSTLVVDSGAWEIRQHSWSPDSRFLAYAIPTETEYHVIKVYDLTSKKSHVVTDAMFNSSSPSWDPDGKYLFFLQDATFNPRLCHVESRFIFDEMTRLYLLVLKVGDKSPFAHKADVEEDQPDEDKKQSDKKDKEKEKEKKKEMVKVEVDFADLSERKIEVDVPSGNYRNLRAIPGKLYYLSYRDRGMLAERRPDEGGRYTLHLYDLKEKKDTVVISGINSYDISDDNQIVMVRKGKDFVRMDAGSKKAPAPKDKDALVNLDDLTLPINPRDEWRQMFNEAWRLQRDFFYDPDHHGVNWEQVRSQYGDLINRISTRDELNDLIGEMIAELAAGHTYVWGGEKRKPKSVSIGLLGIDVAPDEASGKYKITRILAPHPGSEKLCSPLAEPGMDVRVGDYLLAVDNQPVDIGENYLKYLVNKAGKLVQLTVNDKSTLEGAKQLIVKPMASESRLRYTDWVEDRRQYVEHASGGKIGYIHLSNMGGAGLSQFGWQYPPQYKKEGLIVDVRYNGGGFVAGMLLAHLARKVWAIGREGRYGTTYTHPWLAFFGHMATLCNAETGSDGETFTEGVKALKLGPVIGERTWGGWIGIRMDKRLSDRGMVTLPEYPGWALDGEWLIEGWGSEPDIEIINDPASILEGKDPQLDYAIDYLLDKIAEEPKEYPPHPPYPDKSIR